MDNTMRDFEVAPGYMMSELIATAKEWEAAGRGRADLLVEAYLAGRDGFLPRTT